MKMPTDDIVRDQETLYKLIISQLRYDGLDLIATSLSKCVGLEEVALAPSSRLFEIMKLGLQEEKQGNEPESRRVPGLTPSVQPEAVGLETHVKLGLDLEYERDGLQEVWLTETTHSPTKANQKSPLLLDFAGVSNLDLLSHVSALDQPLKLNKTQFEERVSPNCFEDGDFDQKLEFLCNLDLIPAPLVKNCPNATRRWLKTNTSGDCLAPSNNTGINDSYELAGALHRDVHFSNGIMTSPNEEAVVDKSEQFQNRVFHFDLQKQFQMDKRNSTQSKPCREKNIHVELYEAKSDTISDENESTENVKLRIKNPDVRKSGNYVTSKYINLTSVDQDEAIVITEKISKQLTPTLLKTTSPVSKSLEGEASKEIFRKLVDTDQNVVGKVDDDRKQNYSQISGNVVGLSNANTVSIINQIPGRSSNYQQNISASNVVLSLLNNEEGNLVSSCTDKQKQLHPVPVVNLTYADIHNLVLQEIFEQEINQTVFSQVVIGKTQGYLSDLLKKSKEELTYSNKFNKALKHLEKIKSFLKLPVRERKKRYEMYMKTGSTSPHKEDIRKQTRTVISQGNKNELRTYFHQVNGKVTKDDVDQISSRLNLSADNVKIFFKNMKQREKRNISKKYGTSPPVTQYETHYVTAHKGPVTAAAFTPDGRLCSTGSVDTSIKIIDISRMLAKAAQSQAERQAERELEEGGGMKNHPVIRTMYDHDLAVNAIQFHPTSAVLISGGDDKKVNLFDYTKSTVKKAYKNILEVEAVRGLSIHPCGDYLLVATDHPTIRLYDINTLQCFVSSNPDDQHLGALTSVEYSLAAHLYVTSSKDGSWKLWDGVSNRCVQTYQNAHDGAELLSAKFTRNSKFVLTAGRDANAKLWELSTGRCINTYGGGILHNNNHSPAIFNFTEDFVLFPDDKNMAIGCWDSRTSEKLQSLPSGHNNAIRHLVHSPCSPAFLSCSEDYRARFWYCKGS